MIRTATNDDLDTLVHLGERMHNESPSWSRLTYSRQKVREGLRNLIADTDGFVSVAIEKGEIIGALAGACEPPWTSTDLVVSEYALFIAPEARGGRYAAQLTLKLLGWASVKGAKFVRVGTSTGVDTERTVAFYERLGFKRTSDVQLEYQMDRLAERGVA